MLRGSSRHDGIPNKQSARERDRDRLRERQRQERQQMLPNDEKDIIVGAQDLFHAPVKVKPSVDDSTTAQIANTLGSYDTVRHLFLDTSNRLKVNLIGVDQGSLPGTPVATRQPPQALIGGHPSEQSKPYFHPPQVAGQTGSATVTESTTKSHHRNLFSVSASAKNSNAVGSNNSLTNTNTSSSSSSSEHNFVPVRQTGNQHQKGLQQSHNQQHSQLSNSSSNHPIGNSIPSSSASQVTAAVGGSSSSSSSIANSGYATNSASNNNQVRQTALSFNSNNSSSAPSTVTDVSSEGYPNVSSAKTASNALLSKESHESASGADDKNSRHASSNRKTLERADSQLEIESMLKEMMDAPAPLTAIQTPVKETSTKKFTQRRSSKSEEKIVRSILDSGMADVPSPVQRMDSSGDSSSSYESETSDSESEDSSSGSQAGGEKIDNAIPKITPNTNSPTRWNLGAFIKKNDYRGTPPDANTTTTIGGSKSPKDTKPNAHQVNAINSETSPGDAPVKTESVVSSTCLFNKAQSLSPLDTPTTVAPPTRKITRSTVEVKVEPYTPPKPPPSASNAKASNSTNNPVTKSLSGSSSDDEPEKKKKEVTSRNTATVDQDKTANATGAGKRKRKRSSSSAERIAQKSEEESSPENAAKNKNNIKDRNKNHTIRKLFLFKQKVDSPTRGDGSDLGKSPSSGAPSTNGNGATNSSSAAATAANNMAPSIAGGSAGGSTSNRVQAKDSGKKGKADAAVSNNVHNGELDPSASIGANVTEPVSKKRDEGTKEKESTSSRTSHGKKNPKSASGSASTAKSSSIPNVSALLPPPPPPAAKIKEEVAGKSDKSLSSLVVKINLNKLKRKPTMMPAPPPPPPLAPPPPPVVVKLERDSPDKGVKTIKEPPAATSNNADLFLKRVHNNSSRVGSSSDHAKDAKETAVVTHNPPPGRVPPDGSLCSEIDFKGKKRSKSKKVKSSSPKKTKTKHEPDSHSKVEEDTACGEVSSNVLGYASCDSVSVSTTRTPPVESDVVQAPDSSLNPPHLPSPVVPPQPVYFSYFEKSDHLEDYYSRDQDSYLEEAKRLKHKADGERVSTTQASVYLEAGLYFILTGISMERDRTVGSTAAFTMYKDTLVLIRYIGSRFRNRGADFSNPMEAKIIVLSMRCQSMLSLKLFKIKMRETKEMVQYLQDHFQRHPTLDVPPVASSPQLSTPSPHSPTSSPAASSSLHPSPHHPNQIMTTIPRSLYSNMQKTCSSTMNLISAHELWDAADHLVEKYHIEDFFVQLDRQFGPLTLHNSLVDLVRYVKQALQVLKSTSELS